MRSCENFSSSLPTQTPSLVTGPVSSATVTSLCGCPSRRLPLGTCGLCPELPQQTPCGWWPPPQRNVWPLARCVAPDPNKNVWRLRRTRSVAIMPDSSNIPLSGSTVDLKCPCGPPPLHQKISAVTHGTCLCAPRRSTLHSPPYVGHDCMTTQLTSAMMNEIGQLRRRTRSAS